MSKDKVSSVKVRMYRHGFGDCFLISFFNKQDERVSSILIDCGIKHKTKSETVPISVVIEDLKSILTPDGGTKPVIDVLVATHEHWDHIAFFHPEPDDFFAAFDIRQIWLAWTEDPDDDEAVMINSRLREGAAALQFAVAKLHDANVDLATQFQGLYVSNRLQHARESYNASLNDVLGFYGADTAAAKKSASTLAAAAKKNPVSESGIKYKKKPKISVETEVAMTHIIELGKKGGIKYFDPGSKIDSRLLPEGVNGFVLGPPRSSLINKSNPSKGPAHETYFGLGASGLAGFIDGVMQMYDLGDDQFAEARSGAPFGRDEGKSTVAAQKDQYYKETYFKADESYRKIDYAWLDVVGQFSLQLDGAINNTSLVLAFELQDSGKVLLFPGDAQVGSWLSWHDHKWKVKRDDKTETITAEELLKNTVLYKVSHHGSHNATVKELGLELMTHPDLVAMVPEKEKSYNGILYQPLIRRLKTLCKGRVIVSADSQHPPENLKKKRPAELSSDEWECFKRDLDVKPHYVEYTIH